MKSFALAALVATASAQVNFNCVNPTDAAWTETAVADAADAADCGTKGTAAIEALADFKTTDYCLHAAVQGKVEAVPADADADPPVEEVKAVDASVTCAYFALATADPAVDIRTSAPEANSLVYTVWAWSAGEKLDEMVAAAEGDADSAKMITSALAAVATIAMVAY